MIIVGIALVGIAAGFAAYSNPQESPIKDQRTVSWRHVHGVGIDPSDPTLLYIATHGDFYHSQNGDPPVKVDKIRADYMAFNAPYEAGVPLYASGHPSSGGNMGLVKSTDGGITWQLVSTVLDPPVDFHAMAVSKSNPEIIIGFDSAARGLFKTNDAGITWETLNYPEYITALAILPNNENTIFAGTEKGIFRSNDGGKTWQQIEQYRGIVILALAFDDNEILYASTPQFGLTRSSDFGTSWDKITSPNITVTSMTVDTKNQIVYVGGYSPDGFQEVYKIDKDNTVELIGTNKV